MLSFGLWSSSISSGEALPFTTAYLPITNLPSLQCTFPLPPPSFSHTCEKAEARSTVPRTIPPRSRRHHETPSLNTGPPPPLPSSVLTPSIQSSALRFHPSLAVGLEYRRWPTIFPFFSFPSPPVRSPMTLHYLPNLVVKSIISPTNGERRTCGGRGAT